MGVTAKLWNDTKYIGYWWCMTRLCLDLDGVVHPMVAHSHANQHLCCLEALESSVGDRLESTEIVIVSSWRLTLTLEQIRTEIATVSTAVAARIIGATPKCLRLPGIMREPRWA